MDVWIQRHDPSSIDCDDTSIEGALNHLNTTDWGDENRLGSEVQSNGGECCPAGIGFVHPALSILHLCPDGAGRMMLYYHYPIQRRILGLIPTTRQATLTLESIAIAEAESLIRLHYSNDSDAIPKAANLIERVGAGQPVKRSELIDFPDQNL
jgi:hypothetical protein